MAWWPLFTLTCSMSAGMFTGGMAATHVLQVIHTVIEAHNKDSVQRHYYFLTIEGLSRQMAFSKHYYRYVDC